VVSTSWTASNSSIALWERWSCLNRRFDLSRPIALMPAILPWNSSIGENQGIEFDHLHLRVWDGEQGTDHEVSNRFFSEWKIVIEIWINIIIRSCMRDSSEHKSNDRACSYFELGTGYSRRCFACLVFHRIDGYKMLQSRHDSDGSHLLKEILKSEINRCQISLVGLSLRM
jgi:hypothetical protein